MALQVWLPLNGNLKNQGFATLVTSGAPSYVAGKMGQALSLASRVSFTGLPQLNHFTIAFWAKVDSCTADWVDLLGFTSKQSDGTSAASFRFEATISSRACSWHNNSPYAISEGTQVMITNKGEWHHVCVVYDGKKIDSYTDGVLLSTQTGLGGYLIDNFHIGETNAIVGSMNDLRIYDECISVKQIKELSKGLILHYPLNNPYIETTTNLAPGIDNRTPYSNGNPSWDTSLNGERMYTPQGWSSGYNSGVDNPTTGYHGHWVFDEDGKLIMIFPNLNSVIDKPGRWEGISAYDIPTKDILAGEKYTISWWQKTDNLNLAAFGGIHYKLTADGSNSFHDGNITLGKNTQLNTWEFMSHTYTRSSSYVKHDGVQSVYVYGYTSAQEGTVYVKDVQVQKGDKATPYAIDTRQGDTVVYDASGNGYNGEVQGVLKYANNAPKYDKSTNFSSVGAIRYIPSPLSTTMDSFTWTGWVYPTTTGNMALYNHRTAVGNGVSIFLLNGTKLRFDTGEESQFTVSGISTNKWNFIACVYDATANKKEVYINGISVGSTDSIGNLNTIGTYASIGASSTGGTANGGNQVYGNMSDIRIYATALKINDIKSLYQTGAYIDNQDSLGAYDFQETGDLLAYGEYLDNQANHNGTYVRTIVDDVDAPTGKAMKLECTVAGTGFYFNAGTWSSAKKKMAHGEKYIISMYVKANRARTTQLRAECSSAASKEIWNIDTEYKLINNVITYDATTTYSALTNYAKFEVGDILWMHSLKIEKVADDFNVNENGVWTASTFEENQLTRMRKGKTEGNNLIEI